jgi:selenocysteine-specific elongation factor
MKSVTVGTAGHIDHGKSTLVRALTGIDPDRLEEEKRRGITIDIGFAHLELPTPDGRDRLRLGFVDVPGHERFVRNMLAGVGGIDLVILVVAADESIKPQTREHFDICRMLDIRRGLTVLTKSDLVDADTLEVVRLEVEEFLRGSFLDPATAPIIPVSATTGAGLERLRQELAQLADNAPARDPRAALRLPIDRVFSIKGFGTVVTGTLISGTVRKEEEVEVLPGARRVRVRGVQNHNQAAEHAIAGQRTALNLAAISPEELARGMMLVPAGLFRAGKRLDVEINLLASARPLKDRARVHLHAYTAETVAEVVLIGQPGTRAVTRDGAEGEVPDPAPRAAAAKELRPGESGLAQLRLADPVALLPSDRFILRQFSPVVTIAGGSVLDIAPMARRMSAVEHAAFLRRLQSPSRQELLAARIARRQVRGLPLADAVAETGWLPAQLAPLVAALVQAKQVVQLGETLVASDSFQGARAELLSRLTSFHDKNRLVVGMNRQELRDQLGLESPIFAGIVESLVGERRIELQEELVRIPGRGVTMQSDEAESKKQIEAAFLKAGLAVPALKDVLASLKLDRVRAQQIVTLLLRDHILIKVNEELVFHRQALDGLRAKLLEMKKTSPKIDISHFKDVTGVTRKYAIPLLEYFDREHVTRRVGNERIIQ